jgi:hypothetical protein
MTTVDTLWAALWQVRRVTEEFVQLSFFQQGLLAVNFSEPLRLCGRFMQ